MLANNRESSKDSDLINLLELFNRQEPCLQSVIEVYDEVQIDQLTFAQLFEMLEQRRDF